MMEEYIEDFFMDYFDGDLHSVFDNDLNPFHDCNLDEHELKRFLSPSIEQWSDFSNQTHPTFVTLDHAKKKQWNLTRNEICHVR